VHDALTATTATNLHPGPLSVHTYTSPKDVFCLRETRVVDGYRRISLFNHTIEVPNVDLHEDVDIHMIPNAAKQVMEIRIWWSETMVHSVDLPLQGFRVHL
jgi:hypothetical protein